MNNVILLNDDGVVNTKLRFPDEFVRHKILDIIGDIYLLNRPILGKITARQTGHLEDIALVKELQKRFHVVHLSPFTTDEIVFNRGFATVPQFLSSCRVYR